MTPKIPTLAALCITAALLAGCSSDPEPVTTGGRAVAAPTAEATEPAPAATVAIQQNDDAEPTVQPSSSPGEKDEDEPSPNVVAQTLLGKSSDGREVSVRVDAAAPEDLQAYFEDTGAGDDFLYVMAKCEDWCSLADLGPMKFSVLGGSVESQPVAGLEEQEGPIFDVAPVEAEGGAKLPATGEKVDRDRADALWDRAYDLSEKYRLGSGDSRHVYVVEIGAIEGKITEAQVRMGRQTVKLTPAL